MRRLEECIIVGGKFDKKNFMLVKNRDRAYVPDTILVRDCTHAIEIVFLLDLSTGWIEGMNEYGIGITNTALMVTDDEKEHKIVARTGIKVKDGLNIYKALQYTSVDDAVKSVCDYNGGVNGHTIVANHLKGYRIERTDRHDPKVTKISDEEPVVRTNHGFEHNTGYSLGKAFLSSKLRKSSIENKLDGKETLELLLDKLVDIDHDDAELTPLRWKGKLKTTAQLGMDLKALKFIYRPIKPFCRFLGIKRRNWPIDKEPKIKIKVDFLDLAEMKDEFLT